MPVFLVIKNPINRLCLHQILVAKATKANKLLKSDANEAYFIEFLMTRKLFYKAILDQFHFRFGSKSEFSNYVYKRRYIGITINVNDTIFMCILVLRGIDRWSIMDKTWSTYTIFCMHLSQFPCKPTRAHKIE